jgi:predicted enzyme related to lactoylglutathione lyase
MAQEDQDLRLDYVEFGATDLERTRRFYERVFGRRFEDYGPDYGRFHFTDPSGNELAVWSDH